MAPRNRALFALVGLLSAIAAGCSGGKSGGTPPTASPSNTPTATSSATGIGPITGPSGITTASPTAGATTTPFVLKTATPIPAATAAPTGAANTVPSRPLANGDAFTYDGTTSESFVFTGTNPNPSSTSVTSIVQHVAVSTNKSFDGATGLDEYATSETDTGTNATTTITTASYYGTTAGPTNPQTSLTQTALTLYGSVSTDSSGESLTALLANPGYANDSGTVDLLPEETTPRWTNGTAETIDESESDGFTATRTYNADGSYVEHATYPQTSAASPQPTPLAATITENSDGSGTYNLPLFAPPNITIDFAKPTSSGLITITFTDAGGNTLATEQSSAWFPQPLSSGSPLYSEIDRNNGAVSIPAACNASSSYGTTANELEQKSTRIDTILGTLELFDQLTFVASDGAAVCVQLTDVTYAFYDYSGQSNPDDGVGISGGNSPLETQTVATTLGLQAGAIANAGARRGDAVQSAVRASAVANARANFLRTVDRYRVRRERTMAAHFRTYLARFRR